MWYFNWISKTRSYSLRAEALAKEGVFSEDESVGKCNEGSHKRKKLIKNKFSIKCFESYFASLVTILAKPKPLGTNGVKHSFSYNYLVPSEPRIPSADQAYRGIGMNGGKYSLTYNTLCFFTFLFFPLHTTPITLSKCEAKKIGEKIWYNESRSSIDKLTWWTKGEQWASLGIGHFIWYPVGKQFPYTQTFPDLLKFLARNEVELPAWLKKSNSCPWQTEEEFFANFSSTRMKELRTLLSSTIELQTQFITDRLEKSLPNLLTQTSQKKKVKRQFYRIAQSPLGMYALIDYLNFKGEGTNPDERYNDQGWGLLQVLEKMEGSKTGKQALQEFAETAKTLLTLRVQNSPAHRNEAQWIKGWHNRINTYIE